MSKILKLTENDVPSGSLIAVFSDIHIPHHDADALKAAIELCEWAGVTHTLANGDIADCGPSSRHEEKRKRAVLDEGCLRESIAAGLWIYEWLRTRPCIYTLGNHEAWIEKYIAGEPALKGTPTTELMGLWNDGDGWVVLPSKSRVRLGNRIWEHGDGIFANGTGGLNPGPRVRSVAPDQSTSIGHLHRKWFYCWSSLDENGIQRTRASIGNGHWSLAEAHEDYAGGAGYQNWQQSLELTRIWWDGGRPRWTTDQPEVLRDKRGRPFLEYQGKIFK